ncbi:hypothetical protein BJX65DRAFT_89901 [Aspergillus insuetus]
MSLAPAMPSRPRRRSSGILSVSFTSGGFPFQFPTQFDDPSLPRLGGGVCFLQDARKISGLNSVVLTSLAEWRLACLGILPERFAVSNPATPVIKRLHALRSHPHSLPESFDPCEKAILARHGRDERPSPSNLTAWPSSHVLGSAQQSSFRISS